ncbi:hypothetical protein [uncultured Thiodictyon sp.]|jgi:hypothetical protein|uniref:hypothetical protein n=1 Tax=uncultured Thiodictyon sp. TaxID=1846217 RepID=UPI0025F67FE8|nr:hypothetical protein [uncultured Thiodictyon sp.]
MQITLDLPDQLAEKLATLPDPRQFVIDLPAESLTDGLSRDEWWLLLEGIERVAVHTGITDLAERHDHYLSFAATASPEGA